MKILYLVVTLAVIIQHGLAQQQGERVLIQNSFCDFLTHEDGIFESVRLVNELTEDKDENVYNQGTYLFKANKKGEVFGVHTLDATKQELIDGTFKFDKVDSFKVNCFTEFEGEFIATDKVSPLLLHKDNLAHSMNKDDSKFDPEALKNDVELFKFKLHPIGLANQRIASGIWKQNDKSYFSLSIDALKGQFELTILQPEKNVKTIIIAKRTMDTSAYSQLKRLFPYALMVFLMFGNTMIRSKYGNFKNQRQSRDVGNTIQRMAKKNLQNKQKKR